MTTRGWAQTTNPKRNKEWQREILKKKYIDLVQKNRSIQQINRMQRILPTPNSKKNVETGKKIAIQHCYSPFKRRVQTNEWKRSKLLEETASTNELRYSQSKKSMWEYVTPKKIQVQCHVEIKERGTKGQKSWLFWNQSRTVRFRTTPHVSTRHIHHHLTKQRCSSSSSKGIPPNE